MDGADTSGGVFRPGDNLPLGRKTHKTAPSAGRTGSVLTCLIKYNSLYLLRLRHHLQCPFPGRDNRGRRVCEPERLPEPGFIQAVQAVFQNKVEDTAAEGITPVSYTHLDVYKRQALNR